MRGEAPVTILTSGVGLGSYVPALLNERALRVSGRSADVEVIEGSFRPLDVERHLAHKAAYQRDFQLALVGHRMTRDVESSLDAERVTDLVTTWARQERRRFIVWSGFWLPVLRQYLALAPDLDVEIDLCRIDAIVSASFRNQPELVGALVREIWLWTASEPALGWRIPVPAGPPVRMADRDRRLVIHGGGWALGDYLQASAALASAGWSLDVLGPTQADWPGRTRRDRRFTRDDSWHPWTKDCDGALTFPPLAQVDDAGNLWPLAVHDYPAAHTLVREARAVVSKPGGGTLIDSLAAATPVVLLEPYGDAEAANGHVWQHLGFGITFEKWQEAGFDVAVLDRLHANLLAARSAGPAYPAGLVRV